MSAVPDVGAARGIFATGRWPTLMLSAWRGLTWRQVLWAAAIGACLSPFLTVVTRNIWHFFRPGVGFDTAWLLRNLVSGEIAAFSFLLCIVVADEATRLGARRARAYAFAVIAASFLSAAVDWSVRHFVMDFFAIVPVRMRTTWKLAYGPSMFLWSLVFGWLATFFYADLQRTRESLARLHRAEIVRAKIARQLLQTLLNTMQARVEPQFLFEALAALERRYETDPPGAERMLDSLIDYLRATMPHMRDSSSTLAREAALVRSFLGVVASRAGCGVSLDVSVPAAIADSHMPPMILLPIVQATIGGAAPPDHEVAVRATGNDGTLRITFRDSGGAATRQGTGELIEVQERVRALYGDEARLEWYALPSGGRETVLEIPHERTHSVDR